MKINNLYPKNEEDKLIKKAEEIMKKEYPNLKIKHFKLTKKHIVVKTEYSGHILFERSDLK